MRKILIVPVTLLVTLVMINTQAGASPLFFPTATLSSESLEFPANTSEMIALSGFEFTGPNPIHTSAANDLLPGTRPLDDLAAISWGEMNIQGDQTFLSGLLDLPSYNETLTQVIAREDSAFNQAMVPANTLLIISADQQSISMQRDSTPMLNCEVCHIQQHSQNPSLIRGAD